MTRILTFLRKRILMIVKWVFKRMIRKSFILINYMFQIKNIIFTSYVLISRKKN